MDFTFRNLRLPDAPDRIVDLGVMEGRIAAIGGELPDGDRTLDLGGRLVLPGFVETHIHLDKACVLHRCSADRGDVAEAISEVARIKPDFTEEDVAGRAGQALRKCVVNGTTRMRTHVEVDPVIGLRGFEGVKRAIADWRWAVDVEICVFPQEGLLNNPGTDALMVAALKDGAGSVGAAPYTDTDPHGQIDRVFEMARDFDVDIDMHLDFSTDISSVDADYVMRKTDEYGWGGRVAIGHVSKFSAVPPAQFDDYAKRLANSGVAVTVLPATDLFLMGREHDHSVPRGVSPVHRMLEQGVTCSLSTNNILNPFTPFGDGSLIRMANLYANIAQVGRPETMAACLEMVSTCSARLMNLMDYGLAVGKVADLVVVDNSDPALAVAEISQPLKVFKAGRQTVERPLPELRVPR
ncbi:amidohydrolase family protein [Nisaea acidiphila]|uniref:Amidohydrolase family protein n=1 Tax=Nisaea acidiphila TaxID=1862145 RepID=A0A9J7APA8_9PROT|nr:amidohydrolase family protein [Nisaea acidiphila]UUX49248.1 amidohydrolase family protein [Nisaea acidiphila]